MPGYRREPLGNCDGGLRGWSSTGEGAEALLTLGPLSQCGDGPWGSEPSPLPVGPAHGRSAGRPGPGVAGC